MAGKGILYNEEENGTFSGFITIIHCKGNVAGAEKHTITEGMYMTKVELENCINLYGSEIFSFCRYLTGSVQEGEELYQDVFLCALELEARGKQGDNPKSYLLSIAINLWKNKRRKYAWRKRILNMDSLEEMEEVYGEQQAISYGETLQPEAVVLLREQASLVRKHLAELPEKYKLPLYLYFAAELSIKEMAICLKVPEGTVKSRLHRAKQLMKERLEELF